MGNLTKTIKTDFLRTDEPTPRVARPALRIYLRPTKLFAIDFLRSSSRALPRGVRIFKESTRTDSSRCKTRSFTGKKPRTEKRSEVEQFIFDGPSVASRHRLDRIHRFSVVSNLFVPARKSRIFRINDRRGR